MIDFTSWGPIDEATVVAFEQEIGFPLPADYRTFIKEHNGCRFNDKVFFVKGLEQDIMLHVFYGITNERSRSLTLRYWLNEYGEDIENQTLLFGSDPGGGFLMYITTGEDKGIYYWDHAHFFETSTEEDGNTYFVAESFADFSSKLRPFVEAS